MMIRTPHRKPTTVLTTSQFIRFVIAGGLVGLSITLGASCIRAKLPTPKPQAPSAILTRAIEEQHGGHWAAAWADVQKAIRAGNVQPAALNLLIAAARQQHHLGRAYLLVADLGSRHRISVSQSQNIIAALIRHGPVQTLPAQLVNARNKSIYGTQLQWAWRDYLLGVAAARCGEHRQAINWLQAARIARPKFWPATELLADQLTAIYQFANAEDMLQDAIHTHWHRRQALRALIGDYCAQDRLRKALILAQKAAGKYKTDPDFQLLVARIDDLRQQENIEQVVLTRLLQQFPNFKPAYLDLLALAQRNGDVERIQAISARYIQAFPNDIFSSVLRSRLAAQRGDAALSEQILVAALRTHPANIQLWLARIELAIALKEPVSAQSLARQAMVLNPDSRILADVMAQLLSDKPDPCIAVIQAFAGRHGQSPGAQQDYVQTLLEYKRYAQCRTFLHPLIRHYPKAHWIQQCWVDYLDATHNYQAERTFLAAITSGPAPRVSDLLLLATVDYQLHDLPAEEAAYKKVLSLEPANAMAANDLGYTLTIENKELPYAQKIIEIAVRNHPGDAASRDSLGWVLYKRGHFRRALAQLKQAVQLPGGESPEGLEHLGAVLNKLGHSHRAIMIWKVALKDLAEEKTLSKHQQIVKKRIEARIKKATLWLKMKKSGGVALGPASHNRAVDSRQETGGRSWELEVRI